VTFEGLEERLQEAPLGVGTVRLIVRRPDVDTREVIPRLG
jgi:hypothetical protein